MESCKKCLVIGAASMAIAVFCGAIGAHAIKSVLLQQVDKGEITDVERFDISHSWDVAVRNHAVHSLSLILLGLAVSFCSPGYLRSARALLLAGILLFSGLIYIYTGVKVTSGTELTPLMYLVPLGGISWILGWILLAVGFFRGAVANSELS